MYSLMSSSIVDKITDSSKQIKDYDSLPEKYYKLSDIINDHVSILYFFLKKYYEIYETQCGLQYNNEYIYKLIDKYHNVEKEDLNNIYNIIIEHDDLELFTYVSYKNSLISLNEILNKYFSNMMYNNSFKILNYF